VKILIAPGEIANQIYLNSKGLLEIDDKLIVETVSHVHQFYNKDRYTYVYNNTNAFLGLFRRIRIFIKLFLKYDVYIYHYGSSLSHSYLLHFDVFLNKIFGKKIIVYFHGSDIRNPEIEIKRNRWYVNPYKESSFRSNFNCKIWSYFTCGNVIFSDPTLEVSLINNFPYRHFLKLSIDVLQLKPRYPTRIKKIKVFHIPSNSDFKGTKYIRESVADLLRSGNCNFEYIEYENISHEDAMNYLIDSDLVIDQLMIGAHGVFALEAMALGKPVICNIWESDYARHYDPSFPIISANPDNLTNVLFEWISCDLEVRKNKGKESRKYVEKFHNYNSGSNSLFKIIEKL
jgi:glycosyltransferase involved in cell wall biosynthesis